MKLTPIAANQTEVETNEGRIFFSYKTPVAAYLWGKGYIKTEKYWSVTTSRHINKWMGKQNSEDCDTVSQQFLDNLA